MTKYKNFLMCISISNTHLMFDGLRSEDRGSFVAVRNRIRSIGENSSKMGKLTNALQNSRQKAHLFSVLRQIDH